ncbi:universal stress protein [Rosenbergiella australiborealis]|uniref:Universal stress protein n=1 Tax=Rosenbergiella australiborealis TaxID=1544696 RepID=A0ABS5T8E8_9GAMM|nr:universal stress protein [Rosenbergiella australiborealis]MBT0727697.1 universal stress protein [Rosenbergiella australiborealis]
MNTLLMAIDHRNTLSSSIGQLTLDEAQSRKASVVIICCIEAEDDVEGEVMTIDCAIDENSHHTLQRKDLLNCAEMAVRAALVPFQQAGIPARGKVCRGDAARYIVDQANQLSASMIIMGRRHLSPFNRFLRGSVSAAVLETASCPVLIDLSHVAE